MAVLLLTGTLVVATGAPARATAAGVSVTKVDGGPLADVVIDTAGNAYASNTARDRVEVLSLATQTLQAPIPVGDQPYGLDLSADGKQLYVANYGSHYVSVVDLAQRREVSRIDVPSGRLNERPFWIAVANDGTALVSTAFPGSGGSPLSRIDLGQGTVQQLATISSGSRLRASGDRSRIGIAPGSGAVSVYTAAGRTLSVPRPLATTVEFVGLDRTGSTLLADPGTFVLGPELTLRATVPSGGRGVAVDGRGTTGYRVMESAIDLIDLTQRSVVGSIPLPESLGASRGAIALSPDDRTLVALTGTGLTVALVSAAVPSTPCTSRSTGRTITVCGGPLADVVIDGAGRAYASNPARSQVEVVSLATGTLEAPIIVGSQPRGLDLSADGKTLYVANSGANDVSVVDVSLRREVRRISVAPGSQADRPFSIAVAANGTALLSTIFDGGGYGARMLQLDLGAGTVRTRPDFRNGHGATLNETWLKANADRSHIGIVPPSSEGEVILYDSAADTFTPPAAVGSSGRFVAVDRAGSRILLGPGGHILDGDLVLRATVPGAGRGVALNAAGSIGYRVQDASVDVIDLPRGLKTASIPLASPVGSAPGVLALSPDGAVLVVLTAGGLALARTSDAVPLPACVARTAPPGVVAVCGAPLANAVVGPNGRMYASNTLRNQVEVISLATRTLEAPIMVGSQPKGLDLSPDGKKLYVANSGGNDVSVVDLDQRREIRRITVPPERDHVRPFSIAVAANGRALLTTTFDEASSGLRFIDMVDETVEVRGLGVVADAARLEVSADRSAIAVVEDGNYFRRLTMYDAETGTFGRPVDAGARSVGLDGTGSKVVVQPSGAILDGELVRKGTVPNGGGDVAVNAAGTIGYAIGDAGEVGVLDLVRNVVDRSIRLPEVADGRPGSVVLSPDEGTLAVLSETGVAIVPVSGASSATPYTVWSQPDGSTLDGTGGWIAPGNDPVAVAGQLPAKYLYGHYFSFARGQARGVVGLVTDPSGKFAMVSVVGEDGATRFAAVPFDWSADRLYFPFVKHLGSGEWAAWVYDSTAATWTLIGVLALPVDWGRLAPGRITAVVWFGAVAANCSVYPRAEVVFAPLGGYSGSAAMDATLVVNGVAPEGACPAATTVEQGGSVRVRHGADRPAP